MTQQSIYRNPFIEGILELGRNWALAVAVASAGMVAMHTETVDGPKGWEQYVAAICIVFSVCWMFLAGARFLEVVSHHAQGKGSRAKVWFALLTVILIFTGVAIIKTVGQFAFNARVVKICESGTDPAKSKIPHYDECKRLAAQRKELSDRLEGRETVGAKKP